MTTREEWILSLKDKFSAKMNKAGKSSSKFAKQANIANRSVSSLTKGVGAMGAKLGVAFGVSALGRDVINRIKDFEVGMSRVKALTRPTAEEFTSLREKALQLGQSTQYSATQASEGMSFLARAGFKTNQIIAAIPSALSLAAAGELELAEAADIASNVLSGFKMPAEQMTRVSDVLAATANNANTDVRQLGEAMKYASPLAKAAGISLEETAAAMGILGNAGIQASMAGTNMRMAISTLISERGQKDLAEFGIATKNANGDMRNMADIIRDMKAKNLTPANMMSIFGERAGVGMQVLLAEGGDALEDFTKKLTESGGEAARVAEEMQNNWAGDIEKMKSAWGGFVQEVINGNNDVGNSLRTLTQDFTKLISSDISYFTTQSYLKDLLGKGGKESFVRYMLGNSTELTEFARGVRDVLSNTESGTGDYILALSKVDKKLKETRETRLSLMRADKMGSKEWKKNEMFYKTAMDLRAKLNKLMNPTTASTAPLTATADTSQASAALDGLNDKMKTTITGAAPQTFNINIENLIEKLNINSSGVTGTAKDIQKVVTDAIMKGLADVQTMAG